MAALNHLFLNEEQFILLAIKVLSGQPLPGEPEELRRQMVAHEAYRTIFEKLSVYWKADTHLVINEDAALDKVWNRIEQGSGSSMPVIAAPEMVITTPAAVIATPEMAATTSQQDGEISQQAFESANAISVGSDEPTPVRKIGWKRFLTAAAVLIPLLALSIWYFRHTDTKAELVEKYNQKGIRSIIILPDGSKIWLNADSRLKYPAVFSDHLREVSLEGEAFFEIAKNSQRPFVVHLPKGNVQVLGTSFDIRAYSDEELISTSVATGMVNFIPIGAGADSFYLTANRKAMYDFQSGRVNVVTTDAEADRGWINGVMNFNNQSLGRIATELERAFGKPIKFRSVAIAQFRYTATFKNNTEEEILSTLRKVKSFHFTVTDKFIEINK